MRRGKTVNFISFFILGINCVLFAGVECVRAQQPGIIPQPALAPDNSQVAEQVPSPASLNQRYERIAKAREACKTLWSNHAFDPLRAKLPLAEDKPTLSMLTNKHRIHPKDKPLVDLAIRTLAQCRAAYDPVLATLPPHIYDKIKDQRHKEDALIAELYAGKITFGEFNVIMSYMTEEVGRVLFNVPHSTQPPPSSSQENSQIAAPGPLPIPKQPAQTPQTIASQPTRLALVIGNSNYSGLPKLSNPANDAQAIAEKLRSMEFHATLVLDASEQDLSVAGTSMTSDFAVCRLVTTWSAVERVDLRGIALLSDAVNESKLSLPDLSHGRRG
jgi:hypothetical protein